MIKFARKSNYCGLPKTSVSNPRACHTSESPGGWYSQYFTFHPPLPCPRPQITPPFFLPLNCRLEIPNPVGAVNFHALSIESERSHMTDQPPSDRFKSEMPQIPGVSGLRSSAASNPAVKLVIGLLAVLLVVFLGARWALRPKHAVPQLSEQQPQIEVPAPAPDPSTLVPHATDADPGIADAEEMAKPWSSKEFFIRNRLTGEYIPGLLVRLPTGSPSQANSYWAFEQKSPYGDCNLEYLT